MNAGPDPQPEKKIIIDEDWKSEVERQRAAARQPRAPQNVATSAPSGPTTNRHVPQASFPALVSMLFTQTLVALGQFPVPGETDSSEPLPVDLDASRFYIDLLEVVAEKVRGNLSVAEDKMLVDTLSQLRMIYVHIESMNSPSRA